MRAPISRFTINGNSMSPVLHPGQDVLSFNWFYKPKVGDIVIVQGEKFKVQSVKRIQKINGDMIWVEGDNADESTDSRHFGPINADQIVGKVIYKSVQTVDSNALIFPIKYIQKLFC